MIITRTPLRISFFGGGTDYPVYYREFGGAVLSTTIDKSCYITCRYLPPFFEYHSRISYSRIENVDDNGAFEFKNAPAGKWGLVMWDDNGLSGGSDGRKGTPIDIKGGGVTDLGKLEFKPND